MFTLTVNTSRMARRGGGASGVKSASDFFVPTGSPHTSDATTISQDDDDNKCRASYDGHDSPASVTPSTSCANLMSAETTTSEGFDNQIPEYTGKYHQTTAKTADYTTALKPVSETKKRLREQDKTLELDSKPDHSVSSKVAKSSAATIPVSMLETYAGILTNLGGLVHYHQGASQVSMCLYQESIQMLMLWEQYQQQQINKPNDGKAGTQGDGNHGHGSSDHYSALPQGTTLSFGVPTVERYEQMVQLYNIFNSTSTTPSTLEALCNVLRKLFMIPQDTTTNGSADSRNVAEASAATVDGGAPLLAFSEPFQVTVNHQDIQQSRFAIPMEHCSMACFFNLGLIHYSCGWMSTALQYFSLASIAAQSTSPSPFEPVHVAASSNIAQMQSGRSRGALGLQ